MARFSEDLRQERERLGVSLETISEVTRISVRHLQALEDYELDQLPGGVFRHEILRNYLSVLGLDARPWVERFDLEQQQKSEAAPTPDSEAAFAEFAENIHRSRPPSLPKRDLRWFGVFAMLLLVLALGWSVWRFVVRGHVVLSTVILPPAAASNRLTPAE